MNKKEREKRRSGPGGGVGGVRRYLAPSRHIYCDHRWAFFVLSGRQIYRAFLDLRICSSALSALEYQCSRWSLGMGFGWDIWERTAWETPVLRGFLHHLDSPPFSFFLFLTLSSSFFFILLHLFLLLTLPLLTTLSLETLHVLRSTRSFDLDQRGPLGSRDEGPARGHKVFTLECHR